MKWGKSKEIQAMRDLIAYYQGQSTATGDQYDLLAQQLRNTLASKQDAIKMGHLETASGLNLPQAKARKIGQTITPMNVAQLNKMHTTNPMSLGGATFAPVNQKVLNPGWEEEDITKRSPYWSLFGYS